MKLILSFLIVLLTELGAISVSAAEIHSHNDYAQSHPLLDAMNENLSSVEADIWLSHGKLQVSHFGFFSKGTLEDLYLKPLQKIINMRHSVYGDNTPFYLWIDIKESSKELLVKLNDVLNRYDCLSVYT